MTVPTRLPLPPQRHKSTHHPSLQHQSPAAVSACGAARHPDTCTAKKKQQPRLSMLPALVAGPAAVACAAEAVTDGSGHEPPALTPLLSPALPPHSSTAHLAPEHHSPHDGPTPDMQTLCSTVDPASFAACMPHAPHRTIDLTATCPSLSHIQHDPTFDPLPSQPPTATYSADLGSLQQAAALLQQGQLVAMPTETVYGLAADALQPAAVRRIFAAKKRPADNPLIVHVSSIDMLQKLYPTGWTLPDVYLPVLAAHWPGPLTVLLPRSPLVPDEVVCGQPTMAVRLPAHPVARALIALSGTPLAAPSANSSGLPSPTLAAHVAADLGGRVPMVVDGGACQCGVESTVLDGLRSPPVVLRPGGVTVEQLSRFPAMAGLQVYRKHFVDAALEAAPTTPGMKYRHYSPRAQVTLLDLGHTLPPAAEAQGGGSAPADRDPGWRGDGNPQIQGTGELAGHSTDGDVVSSAWVEGVRQAAAAKLPGLVAAAAHRHAQAGLGSAGRLAGQEAVKIGVLRTSKGVGCQPGLTAGDQRNQYVAGGGFSNDKNGFENGFAVAGDIGVQVVEYVLGDLADSATVARELFVAIRLLDELGVREMVVEGVLEWHEGLAVMNRLRKAASRTEALQM